SRSPSSTPPSPVGKTIALWCHEVRRRAMVHANRRVPVGRGRVTRITSLYGPSPLIRVVETCMSSTSTLTHVTPIDDHALDVLFRAGRTANSFTDEPVSTETLRELYEIAKYGPTAANSQPLRIVFLTTDEAKARLLPLMSDGNRPKTSTAPVVAILA